MNILIVPEDFRKDQYFLKPLFEAIFTHYGKTRTRVRICNPPLLGGVTEALKSDRLREVVRQYPFVDLFILCVDRDGQVGRRNRLDQIEAEFSKIRPFFAENAWEELETWILAGLTLPPSWTWRQVRSEISVKELYFDPLALSLDVADGPGGGRKSLGIKAARNIATVLAKCPEDLGRLSERISAFIK